MRAQGLRWQAGFDTMQNTTPFWNTATAHSTAPPDAVNTSPGSSAEALPSCGVARKKLGTHMEKKSDSYRGIPTTVQPGASEPRCLPDGVADIRLTRSNSWHLNQASGCPGPLLSRSIDLQQSRLDPQRALLASPSGVRTGCGLLRVVLPRALGRPKNGF